MFKVGGRAFILDPLPGWREALVCHSKVYHAPGHTGCWAVILERMVVGTYVCRDIGDVTVVQHASTCTGTHLPFAYNPRRFICANRKDGINVDEL
jgi:hypothetical protein